MNSAVGYFQRDRRIDFRKVNAFVVDNEIIFVLADYQVAVFKAIYADYRTVLEVKSNRCVISLEDVVAKGEFARAGRFNLYNVISSRQRRLVVEAVNFSITIPANVKAYIIAGDLQLAVVDRQAVGEVASYHACHVGSRS